MADNKPNVNMGPITNPEVDQAIAEMKQGPTPERQNALTEALRKGKMLAPCDFDADVTDGKAHPSQIKFYLVNTNDGKQFFPIFTDLSQVEKMNFGPDVHPKIVVREVKDYEPLLNAPNQTASGLVLNPGTDNIIIPKNLVAIISGHAPAATPKAPVNPAPLNVRFTEPTVYPTKMAMAVYDRAEETEEIKKVWLKMKLVGNAVSFMLLVESDVKEERVLNAIREVAVPLTKNIPCEVVFATEDLKKVAIGEATPLFDRELGI